MKHIIKTLVIVLFAVVAVGIVTYAQDAGNNSTVLSDITSSDNNTSASDNITDNVTNNITENTSLNNVSVAENNTTIPENITHVENKTNYTVLGSPKTENNTTPEIKTVIPSEAGVIKISVPHVTGNRETEYATITNSGCSNVDLTGWKIRTGCEVEFPIGGEIKAGSTLKIHSNSGKNTETDYYLGAKTHIWENPGVAKVFYENSVKY